jgi:peptidoglycan/xylan/chitin deacetylase (PgdA/CDA1 family)
MYAILLYHGIEDAAPSARVMDAVDREYVLDRRQFEAHVEYLAAKPAASVRTVVSFDDGDLSGYTVAAPLLERHGLRGEFFVVTRWIGTPGFMTASHLRELGARGHGIHSHSRTHARLSSLTAPQIDEELRGSKEDLETLLGRPVTQFSIPGGDYDARVIDIARRAGYTSVLNSVEGYNEENGHAFLLHRFTPRAYSPVSMLAGICEHPTRTVARLAMKRTALRLARGVLGEAGYGRLRERLVRGATLSGSPTSRRRDAPDSTCRR